MTCGVGCTCDSDPELLWLWRRPVPIAPIRPLAWEPPCAMGAGLEKDKKKKKRVMLKEMVVKNLELFQNNSLCWR